MQLSHRHSSLELTDKFKNVILDVRKARDDEAEVGLPVPSGKRSGPPHLAIKALVARNDVALARMQAIAYDQVAGNSYITDRGPIECEDKNREKVFGGIASDRQVVESHSKEIRMTAWDKFAGGQTQSPRTIDRGAIKEPGCQAAATNLIEDRALLILQPEMIVELACILKWINLRLAV